MIPKIVDDIMLLRSHFVAKLFNDISKANMIIPNPVYFSRLMSQETELSHILQKNKKKFWFFGVCLICIRVFFTIWYYYVLQFYGLMVVYTLILSVHKSWQYVTHQ